MTLLATTTVSIYDGSGTDSYGDPTDDNTTPAATGVEASIIEQRRTVFGPDDNQGRIVRIVTGRTRPDVDVQPGFRLRDERTDLLYAVNSVDQTQSPVGTPDLRMDLTRVS